MRVSAWVPAALLSIASGCVTETVVIRGGGGSKTFTQLPAQEVLGDGTPESVSLTTLFEASPPFVATDLDFNPERPDELWVLLRQPPAGEPCNQPLPGSKSDPSCNAYRGRVAIVSDSTGESPSAQVKEDPNAWHFMRTPTGIAFGGGDTFATCGEARTGNWDDQPADFMGPTLWSSAPDVFAVQPTNGNGSHLDMLHASPFCMGIAHERDNVYWAFNGQIGALDRYDFRAPHEPGGENHLDGQAWRWALGEVTRVPTVPSHLVFDPSTSLLYAVDGGGARVLRVDTRTGSDGAAMPTHDAQLPSVTRIDGATIEEVVRPGVLDRPSGIALNGGTLLVTDNATSRIHMFDLDGNAVRALDTGLPSGTLAGVAVGPDGKVYLADVTSGVVRRVDPR
jgi:hypothetical protein